MSDQSQGPDWWQASDGRWYPPEQVPGGGTPAPGTSLGETISWAWKRFVRDIGQWILLWLVYVVAVVAFAAAAYAVAAGGAAGSTGFRFDALGLVIGVVGGMVQGVLLVVVARGAATVADGGRVDLAGAFRLTGPNVVAGVLFGLVSGIANSFCFVLGLGAWVLLGFVPVLSALDDKGTDALGESVSLTTAHPGEAGLFWLVSWLITGCTCGIGAPISMLGGTYLVKRYRGESIET